MKVVHNVSQDTFHPHLEISAKSCPICVPGHKPTTFGNFCEKLSYLCPRTQTDHIWKFLRKVVLFVSQDTNRPHLRRTRFGFYYMKVVLFVSQDSIPTHFIFLRGRKTTPTDLFIIYTTKVVQYVSQCPGQHWDIYDPTNSFQHVSYFVHIYHFRIYLRNFSVELSQHITE